FSSSSFPAISQHLMSSHSLRVSASFWMCAVRRFSCFLGLNFFCSRVKVNGVSSYCAFLTRNLVFTDLICECTWEDFVNSVRSHLRELSCSFSLFKMASQLGPRPCFP